LRNSALQLTRLRNTLQWVRENQALFVNTGSLVCTLVVTSALGFVYWWVAARRFSLSAVGLGSAAVAAMSLLATLCLLGLGTLLITEIPRRKGEEASLVSTALIVVGVASGAAGTLFALIAPVISRDFQLLRDSPLAVLLFASGVILTAVTLILDQVFIALLRSSVVLWRNLIWSLVKLGTLFVISLWLGQVTGMSIYATWAIGNLISLLPLASFIWQSKQPMRSYAPQWGLLSKLGRDAFLHHILNLIVQAPTLALPIIVTIMLSASVNAWFYVASLIATFLFALTVSLTIVLHATNPLEPLVLRQKTRMTMSFATGVSIIVGGVLIIGGHWILSLFGPGYAEHALWSLQVLALGAFPLIIKNHYLAIARVKKLIAQAIGPITLGAILELGIAALGARLSGLSGLSIGWVVAMYLEALMLFPLIYQTLTYRPEASESSPDSANNDLSR
jgi:O-antigen/teichoic acid export membrane protein